MRKIAVLFCLLFCVLLSASSTKASNLPLQDGPRPAVEMLAFGEKYFPYPIWGASVREDPEHREVTGTWRQPGNIFDYRWILDQKSQTMDQLLAVFDDSYVLATLTSYKDGKILQRCIVKDHIVVYAEAHSKTYQGESYALRYWLSSDSRGWHEMFMSFTRPDFGELDQYAEKIFGVAAKCPIEF